jgi:long-chain acyl-CoA synthetase
MPNWSSVYFAVTFKGAVAVPILPDFSSNEVGNILVHSPKKFLMLLPEKNCTFACRY